MQLARERLRQRARAKLGDGDVCALGKALDGRGGAGEEQRARAARDLGESKRECG